MNINAIMKLVFAIIISGIVIGFISVSQLNGLINDIDKMALVRYQSYQTADELRQSSDDLTRLGRTYVVTADPQYENMFMDILDIRNGKKPRPENYHRIYWDLVLQYGQKPKSDGDRVALRTMMETLGYTQQEFDLLKEAQNNSDALVNMEVKAMNAVKGIFQDSEGKYTVKGEPDQKMAIELLHSAQYHREKAKIMAPIDRFFNALEQRTITQFEQSTTDAKTVVWIGNITLLMVLVVSVIAYFIVNKKIVAPLGTMANTLRKVDDQSDLTLQVVAQDDNELGAIGRTINKVLNSYSSTLNKINEMITTIADISNSISSLSQKNMEVVNQQNIELEMATTAMEEISSKLSNVCDNTAMAEKFAAKTDQESSTSKDFFEKTMAEFNDLELEFVKTSEMIKELADESNNVGNVLDVIKAIAEQTNLLALNAAIEAARAGESGRGFAVVADEVRSLAQRTQDSTGEIESIVKTLQEKAQRSVQTIKLNADKIHSTRGNMEVANDALAEIESSTSEIYKLNTSIVVANDEQRLASNEICANLTNVKSLSTGLDIDVKKLDTIVGTLSNSSDKLYSAIKHIKTERSK